MAGENAMSLLLITVRRMKVLGQLPGVTEVWNIILLGTP
jgi:hypothetical protein